MTVLVSSLFEFRNPRGRDLLDRCEPFARWVEDARTEGLFPFIRHHLEAPDTHSCVVDFGGHSYRGLNLASQDYLGLARHPAVIESAVHASINHGTHSAGSEPMGGGMAIAKMLEAELGAFIGYPHVVLFPTGWGAGYGAIKALVRPYDHVVIDALAHDCLQQGARASTPNVTAFAHNDLASLERRLTRIRRKDGDAAVLVVTESLFSMDSDHPDFLAIGALCRAYSAGLLVDAAHDLGVLGPAGRGVLAEQSFASGADIVVGSFSKTFACLGGFVATRSAGASYYVRGFSGTYTFSNFLMPAQVAAVRAALEIVRSNEGDGLRQTVLKKAMLLRNALHGHGLTVKGRLSPIVLPVVGAEAAARLAQRSVLRQGVIVNSIEYPACRLGEARFRLQVTPRHEDADLHRAAEVIARCIVEARRESGALAIS